MYSQTHEPEIVTRTCAHCGQAFEGLEDEVFCTAACFMAYDKKKTDQENALRRAAYSYVAALGGLA